MRDASPPPAIFNNVLDEQNFSMIVRTKCIIFGEALKVMGQKHKQTLPDCSECTKMAITVSKFSKNFRKSMPPDP